MVFLPSKYRHMYPKMCHSLYFILNNLSFLKFTANRNSTLQVTSNPLFYKFRFRSRQLMMKIWRRLGYRKYTDRQITFCSRKFGPEANYNYVHADWMGHACAHFTAVCNKSCTNSFAYVEAAASRLISQNKNSPWNQNWQLGCRRVGDYFCCASEQTAV